MAAVRNQYRYKWWALIGICLLAFTAFLDFTIVSTAIPFIKSYFKVRVLDVQWIMNIFPIVLSMTMIMVGKIADYFGRKKIFYFGIVLFGIAAFGAGASPSLNLVIFFRALQALGGATVFIVSASLLSSVFPEKERVLAISIYGGVTGFGLMVGPFFGGMLISALDWRWVFWINLPIILVGLLFCSFSLRGTEEEMSDVEIDWSGIFLLVVGLGASMFGIIQGANTNWHAIIPYICIGVGVLALIVLILIDRKKKISPS